MSDKTDQARVDELEIKLAFLEDALQQLSDEFLRLQKDHISLQHRHEQLSVKLQSLQSDGSDHALNESERPPHY